MAQVYGSSGGGVAGPGAITAQAVSAPGPADAACAAAVHALLPLASQRHGIAGAATAGLRIVGAFVADATTTARSGDEFVSFSLGMIVG